MRDTNARGERLYYICGFRDWEKEDCCFAMHDIQECDIAYNIEANVRLSNAIIFEITPQSSYPKLEHEKTSQPKEAEVSR